jgi:hypothetical protein
MTTWVYDGVLHTIPSQKDDGKTAHSQVISTESLVSIQITKRCITKRITNNPTTYTVSTIQNTNPTAQKRKEGYSAGKNYVIYIR